MIAANPRSISIRVLRVLFFIVAMLQPAEASNTKQDVRAPETGGSARKPASPLENALSNYQFAAVFLFQLHRQIKRFNRAFHLIVRGWLGGNALQPQARFGKHREK